MKFKISLSFWFLGIVALLLMSLAFPTIAIVPAVLTYVMMVVISVTTILYLCVRVDGDIIDLDKVTESKLLTMEQKRFSIICQNLGIAFLLLLMGWAITATILLVVACLIYIISGEEFIEKVTIKYYEDGDNQ